MSAERLSHYVRGKWFIEYNPKPIGSRLHDWDFWHEDHDGAPDSNCEHLCGTAKSIEAAEVRIEELNREYFRKV